MKPKVDAGPADTLAPTADVLTDYDRLHLITYIMLLDAAKEGVEPLECARVILQIDPVVEPERALQSYESHFARAQWMTRSGYQQILNDPALRQA